MNYIFDLDLETTTTPDAPLYTAKATIENIRSIVDIKAMKMDTGRQLMAVRGLAKIITEYRDANQRSKVNSGNSKKWKRDTQYFEIANERIAEIQRRFPDNFDGFYWSQVAINYLGSSSGRPKSIDYDAYILETYSKV
jgi:hypothetical protein